jgi:hypothetical protein
MPELTGWLLDLYPDPQAGAALWLLGEDGQRRRLQQDFPLTFYAAGPAEQLRQLWRFLQAQPEALTLSRTERRDLFCPQPLPGWRTPPSSPGSSAAPRSASPT